MHTRRTAEAFSDLVITGKKNVSIFVFVFALDLISCVSGQVICCQHLVPFLLLRKSISRGLRRPHDKERRALGEDGFIISSSALLSRQRSRNIHVFSPLHEMRLVLLLCNEFHHKFSISAHYTIHTILFLSFFFKQIDRGGMWYKLYSVNILVP